jgi:hypothetical protein
LAEDESEREDENGETFFAYKPNKVKTKQRKESDRPDPSMVNEELGEFQIDQLFGHIFGIERIHILKKTDRLQDVIEKIAIVPEHKLVYVEDNNDKNYSIQNILTQGELLNYLCRQEDA